VSCAPQQADQHTHPHTHTPAGEAADASLCLEPGPVPGMVSTTKEMLMRFVRDHVPTSHKEKGKGKDQGGMAWHVLSQFLQTNLCLLSLCLGDFSVAASLKSTTHRSVNHTAVLLYMQLDGPLLGTPRQRNLLTRLVSSTHVSQSLQSHSGHEHESNSNHCIPITVFQSLQSQAMSMKAVPITVFQSLYPNHCNPRQ